MLPAARRSRTATLLLAAAATLLVAEVVLLGVLWSWPSPPWDPPDVRVAPVGQR